MRREVWERFVANDMAAFEALYDEFAPLVERIARRSVAAAADRDDVCHDTWIHIHDKRHTFDVERHAEGAGWIAQVARSRCVDFHRRRGRTTAADDVEALAATAIGADPPADPEQVVMANDLRRRARVLRERALLQHARRHPEMDAFVRLYYDDDHGHDECARALRVTVRHTKYLNRLFKAAIAEDPLFLAFGEPVTEAAT